MATAYNTAQTPGTLTNSPVSSPWAAGNYTPAAGSNRMAIVVVGYGFAAGAATTTAVSLGGQSMTQVGSNATDSSWVSCSTWRLNEAGIAAMSGAALSVTLGGGGSATQACAVCFTLTGSDGTTSSPQTGSGTGTTASSSAVTSTSDGLVIAGVMTDAGDGSLAVSGSGADDSGTLKIAESGADTMAGAQYITGSGGSITPSWTQNSNGYAVVAFNVNAVAGGGGATIAQGGLTLLGVQ